MLHFNFMNLTSESCSSTQKTPGRILWRKPPIFARRYATATLRLESGEDWQGWLAIMAEVQRRLQRIIKHHRVSWQRMRRDYEVAKATQEARAGCPQRAINLIFGADGSTMVDSAFWKQQTAVDESGVTLNGST